MISKIITFKTRIPNGLPSFYFVTLQNLPKLFCIDWFPKNKMEWSTFSFTSNMDHSPFPKTLSFQNTSNVFIYLLSNKGHRHWKLNLGIYLICDQIPLAMSLPSIHSLDLSQISSLIYSWSMQVVQFGKSLLCISISPWVFYSPTLLYLDALPYTILPNILLVVNHTWSPLSGSILFLFVWLGRLGA